MRHDVVRAQVARSEDLFVEDGVWREEVHLLYTFEGCANLL